MMSDAKRKSGLSPIPGGPPKFRDLISMSSKIQGDNYHGMQKRKEHQGLQLHLLRLFAARGMLRVYPVSLVEQGTARMFISR